MVLLLFSPTPKHAEREYKSKRLAQSCTKNNFQTLSPDRIVLPLDPLTS